MFYIHYTCYIHIHNVPSWLSPQSVALWQTLLVLMNQSVLCQPGGHIVFMVPGSRHITPIVLLWDWSTRCWSPQANHNPAIFFAPPRHRETQQIPPSRQKKSPDNWNMLHMFNNNTYLDFRIANKHVLVPIYVNRVI